MSLSKELEAQIRAEHEGCLGGCNQRALLDELDAVRTERDKLYTSAKAVVDAGFFIPAMLALREAVDVAGPPPMTGAEFVEEIHKALPDAFSDLGDVLHGDKP